MKEESTAQRKRQTWWRRLAFAQGGFYLLTGIWPLVSIGTFQMVTGPKKDLWLVKTVGALVGVTGATLIGSALRGGPSKDLVVAAAGQAATLTAVDVIYVSKGRIPKVYLLDAVAEVALIAAWIGTAAVSGRRG